MDPAAPGVATDGAGARPVWSSVKPCSERAAAGRGVADARRTGSPPKKPFWPAAEAVGWPNGLKIHRDGRIFITD
jgi:hypothetical protein